MGDKLAAEMTTVDNSQTNPTNDQQSMQTIINNVNTTLHVKHKERYTALDRITMLTASITICENQKPIDYKSEKYTAIENAYNEYLASKEICDILKISYVEFDDKNLEYLRDINTVYEKYLDKIVELQNEYTLCVTKLAQIERQILFLNGLSNRCLMFNAYKSYACENRLNWNKYSYLSNVDYIACNRHHNNKLITEHGNFVVPNSQHATFGNCNGVRYRSTRCDCGMIRCKFVTTDYELLNATIYDKSPVGHLEYC
jgi:hypothetical protein